MSLGVGKRCLYMPCLTKKEKGALRMGPRSRPSDLGHFPQCLAHTSHRLVFQQEAEMLSVSRAQ